MYGMAIQMVLLVGHSSLQETLNGPKRCLPPLIFWNTVSIHPFTLPALLASY